MEIKELGYIVNHYSIGDAQNEAYKMFGLRFTDESSQADSSKD
ncbi:hypothetical protein [Bermanella sp. R86510]